MGCGASAYDMFEYLSNFDFLSGNVEKIVIAL